jgi:hypothetical protein
VIRPDIRIQKVSFKCEVSLVWKLVGLEVGSLDVA